MDAEAIDARVRILINGHSPVPGPDIEPDVANAAGGAELRLPELEMVTLLVAIEDEFGIKISDERAKALVTVTDAIHLVRELTEAAAGAPK